MRTAWHGFCSAEARSLRSRMRDLQLRPAMAPNMDSSASAMGGSPFSTGWDKVAQELWLDELSTVDANAATIKKRIWDPLEADLFNLRSLTTLENLQILERYATRKSGTAGQLANRGQISMAGLLRRCSDPACHSHSMLRRSETTRARSDMGSVYLAIIMGSPNESAQISLWNAQTISPSSFDESCR
jgi:hypothetical protein